MKSLEEQMAFYAAYHRHPMNRVTHFVGVPVLIYSVMVILAVEPLRWSMGALPLDVTPTLALIVVVLAYYVMLDVMLGLAMVAVFGALWFGAESTVALGTQPALIAFGVSFVVGWIVQLLGHGVWEKRRPALVSNLFQVFVAPIFLVAEFFFMLGLKRKVHDEVERIVASGVHDPKPTP